MARPYLCGFSSAGPLHPLEKETQEMSIKWKNVAVIGAIIGLFLFAVALIGAGL
jgi:hypothetical protein